MVDPSDARKCSEVLSLQRYGKDSRGRLQLLAIPLGFFKQCYNRMNHIAPISDMKSLPTFDTDVGLDNHLYKTNINGMSELSSKKCIILPEEL